MMLQRTISQLDIGDVSPDQAETLGHMGYLQWLGALPGDANYKEEAMRAHEMARPFSRNSPAVAVFCHLLVTSTEMPPAPLNLMLPGRKRRGGSAMRRSVI